jgi:hypothetical protein
MLIIYKAEIDATELKIIELEDPVDMVSFCTIYKQK